MADIAELIVALKLQDGVSSGLGRLNGQLKGMGAGLSQVGKGIGQVGAGLGTIATRGAIAAAGIGTAFITTAASMEEAFTGIKKTVDETAGVSFEELRQQLRGMSSDTGTAFEELSRIGEIGGALGVGIESLDEFIDVVNRLSVSTDLTVDTASTALGQLGTILHLTGDDYEHFADTLVALGNAGASTEPQIVELAARFAAAGNRAGLSSNEILALSSAVASMGVEVEAGGTALSQTFNEIALAIGTGSDEVEGFTSVLGISAKEFRRRWETDALGTFQEFLEEISKLDPIAQAVALDMAGITGTRQLSAVGLMADNYGFLAEQLEVAQSATGALGEESDKFFGTSANSFRKLRENVRLAGDAIGTEMLPVVNELITEFVGFMQDPAQQRALKDFGQSLASGIRDFATEIKSADFGPLLETLKGAAAITKGAFDTFRSLPQPIQQLALAAIVANKVTGGALGQIAGGLANIFGGALKTIHAAHVTVIGGAGGGGFSLPGPTKVPFGGGFGGSGLGGLATQFLKFTPHVIAGIIAFELGKGLASGTFRMPWDQPPTKVLQPGFAPKEDRRPDATSDETYQAEDRRPVTATLPNTAMAPVVGGVATVNTSVQALQLHLQSTAVAATMAAASSDAAMLATAQFQASKLDITNAQLGVIAARNPVITNNINISLSPTVIQQRISQIRTLSGSGGFI